MPTPNTSRYRRAPNQYSNGSPNGGSPNGGSPPNGPFANINGGTNNGKPYNRNYPNGGKPKNGIPGYARGHANSARLNNGMSPNKGSIAASPKVNNSNNKSPPARKGSSPSPKSNQQSPRALPENWRRLPEITIILDRLPTNVTTKQLWQWFHNEGEIAYVDIFDARPALRVTSAKIRFEPPPRKDFWSSGYYVVDHPDKSTYPTGLNITVRPSTNVPTGWIRSPVAADRQYPVKLSLRPSTFQIGSMVGKDSMKILKTFKPTPNGRPLKLNVDLRFKRVSVFFPMEVKTADGLHMREYKLLVDFSKMKTMYRTSHQDGQRSLVLPLKVPPHYYWREPDIRKTFSPESKNWNVSESWYRATEIVETADLPSKYPVSLHTDLPESTYTDIGRWTCFRFVFDDGDDTSRGINDLFENALHDFNIQFVTADDFQARHGNPADMWKHLDHPEVIEDQGALGMLAMSSNPMVQLPFEVRYQLEVCVSRGIFNDHTVSFGFLQQLEDMGPVKARLFLEYLADRDQAVHELTTIIKNPDADAYIPTGRTPHYCALVRKAVITPTTIRLNTPVVETSNRIMRRYNHIQDRFLRVQFVEEQEKGRITVNKDQNDEIWKRVQRTLYQGIRIGDRVYHFLAFGSSQLRQCGAYFFCPTNHISCDDIRKWMGSFDHIKVVAKYAARLGQCFSTTREIRGINVPVIRPIEDVERGGACFTDGVGIISDLVSKLVIDEMNLDVFDRPSAYQFRMGGHKGVLTVWPEAKGLEVHVRESQAKFRANYNGLEVIRCAKFATATLNRQTITILESLGVDKRVFTSLLTRQMKAYDESMENNRTAIELLTKFVDENQTTMIIAELLKNGFRTETTQEPFVSNVLKLWRSWSLKLLKEKARIAVEKSAFLLGCVDESGTLRGHSAATEGSRVKDVNKLPQIFLQITDPKEYNKFHIIQGVCIVGRNPSLHPGDIRVVQAVDRPELHHLKDVVVFPMKGDRPVPNMLSGGDLDGDDFFVIWDSDLMPKIWNYPPMSYTGSKPRELDRDVNVDDLRNFFVNYLQNDVLPLIAVSHLAHADDLGPRSPKCLKLAELHSNAVDYPKTGEPVTFKRDMQPKRWPHFMEKNNSYHSNKALGQIYDKIAPQSIKFQPVWDNPFDERILQRYTLDDDLLKSARKVKSQYDTSVRRLLSQHDLKTEFELWTGFAMSKPAIGTSYKQQEDLGHEYDALKHRFREICYEAAGGKSQAVIDPFVAAMYTVTQEEIQIALQVYRDGPLKDHDESIMPARPLEARSMPLMSFPWIFHWVLIRVALGRDYNPKRSMLAPAQRGVNGPQPTTEGRADDQTKKPEPESPADEVQTHLPDGTIVHRGQPLNLFHPEEAPSSTPTSDVEEEADVQDLLDFGPLVRVGGAETLEKARHQPEAADSDSDSDNDVSGGQDGNAMDRLVSLVGE